MTGRPSRGITGAMVAGAMIVALTTASAQMLTGLKAAEPQPTPDKLAPGLAVSYVFGIFNHINEFKTKKSEPGAPLQHLDYRMGEGADPHDQGARRGRRPHHRIHPLREARHVRLRRHVQ